MAESAETTLEQQILREKQLVAEYHLLDAWEAGLEDGIEPEILARAIISKTLDQLAQLRGFATASDVAGEVGEMQDTATYLSRKTIQ